MWNACCAVLRSIVSEITAHNHNVKFRLQLSSSVWSMGWSWHDILWYLWSKAWAIMWCSTSVKAHNHRCFPSCWHFWQPLQAFFNLEKWSLTLVWAIYSSPNDHKLAKPCCTSSSGCSYVARICHMITLVVCSSQLAWVKPPWANAHMSYVQVQLT